MDKLEFRKSAIRSLLNDHKIIDMNMNKYITRNWMKDYLKSQGIKFRSIDKKETLWNLILKSVEEPPKDMRNFWDVLKEREQKKKKFISEPKVIKTMVDRWKNEDFVPSKKVVEKDVKQKIMQNEVAIQKDVSEKVIKILKKSKKVQVPGYSKSKALQQMKNYEYYEKLLRKTLDQIYENELNDLNKSDFTEDDVNQFVNNVWQDVGEAISEAQFNPGAKYLRNLAQDIVNIEFEGFHASKSDMEMEVDRILDSWVTIISKLNESKYQEKIEEIKEKYKDLKENKEEDKEEDKDNNVVKKSPKKFDFAGYGFYGKELKLYQAIWNLAQTTPNLVTFFRMAPKITQKYRDFFVVGRFPKSVIIDVLSKRGFDSKQVEDGLQKMLKAW